MKRFYKFYILLIAHSALLITCYAGNPDRQGEAGAYELLLNPWARTIGVHMTSTAYVSGFEAMNINIAGLGRTKGLEIGLGYSNYLQGTGLGVSALGYSQKIGNGAFGVSLIAMNFGRIPVTTTTQPEGTGSTYSPSFFNLALGYAHTFDEKVSVGISVRLINESLADIAATGVTIDAGVQYYTGSTEYPDRFKFGVALRNVGAPMQYGGQGLAASISVATVAQPYVIRVARNVAQFELPSQLLMGFSYDILPEKKYKLVFAGNYTSNAFSRDELGGAFIFDLNTLFTLRAGYRQEIGTSSSGINSVYTGLSGGVSVQVPLSRGSDKMLSIDYGYLASNPFSGTHNISLRMNL